MDEPRSRQKINDVKQKRPRSGGPETKHGQIWLEFNSRCVYRWICPPGLRRVQTWERMVDSHTRKASEIDPVSVKVHFSPQVRKAFGDLAAAVHFSEHFDSEMLKTVEGWAAGKQSNVHDIFIALPVIADETFKHVHATGDERAAKAWREIGSELLESGFTLSSERHRGK